MTTAVPPSMALCHAEAGQLLVVDVQARLAAAMPAGARTRVLHNIGLLLQAARLLEVPALATEQYPRGLGPTEPEVLACLPAQANPLEKTTFSCCAAPGFAEQAAPGRSQWVLAGMESHVCILQTALELLAQGRQVFVVEDAVCSRRAAHHDNAMQRLRQAGAVITNAESVLFEWLRDAAHPQFKAVSALLKQQAPGSAR